MLLEPDPDAGLRVYARETTRAAGKTFALACRLLPRDVRDDVHLLYLVLRTLDDLVDHGLPDAQPRLRAVELWADGGPASSPESRVLDDLDRRYGLPRDVVRDFCAGMRQDLNGHQPQTEDDLDRYCYRVAGTVGLLMCALLGTTGDAAQARDAAIALGVAMQRTNILRDIDEDARAGRQYLAAESLARFGACRSRTPRGARARADRAR